MRHACGDGLVERVPRGLLRRGVRVGDTRTRTKAGKEKSEAGQGREARGRVEHTEGGREVQDAAEGARQLRGGKRRDREKEGTDEGSCERWVPEAGPKNVPGFRNGRNVRGRWSQRKAEGYFGIEERKGKVHAQSREGGAMWKVAWVAC
jgi:hypothetical protein